MKKDKSYKGGKNSPKVSGDAVGDAYKVKETYTDVGKAERIPVMSKASDSYNGK